MDAAIEKALREQLERLHPGQQRQVLDYARELATQSCAVSSGRALTKFARTIDPDDLALIAAAIDEGCEQVNPDEW